MSERQRNWAIGLAVLLFAGVTLTIMFNSGAPPVGLNPLGGAGQDTVIVPVWSLPLDQRPPGTIVPFRKDANPMTASVAEAIDTNTHPERVTPLIGPVAFDPVRYNADPQTYLNTVEPGRVWQVAQPGPNVTRIVSASLLTHFINPGETTVFRVQIPPGMPVTFTSFDLGAFENLLTTISVKADDKGVAQASFTASPGTTGTVNILASSPVTSGQLRYMVHIPELQDEQAVSSTAK